MDMAKENGIGKNIKMIKILNSESLEVQGIAKSKLAIK